MRHLLNSYFHHFVDHVLKTIRQVKIIFKLMISATVCWKVPTTDVSDCRVSLMLMTDASSSKVYFARFINKFNRMYTLGRFIFYVANRDNAKLI